MAISPTFPGVYVAEKKGDQRTITGVSTSTALFIGMTKSGPDDQPVLCFNYSDYVRQFTDGTTNDDFSRHVRLFFINGGTQCWITRISDGKGVASTITLPSEGKQDVLVLTARSKGALGDSIRAVVSYTSNLPESAFDIELYRVQTDTSGRQTKVDQEVFRNLTMTPLHPLNAVDFLNSNSKLVTAALPSAPTQTADVGYSISAPILGTAVDAMFAAGKQFQISVGGKAFVLVTLGADPDPRTRLDNAINDPSLGLPTVAVAIKPNATDPDVVIELSVAGQDVLVAPASDPKTDVAVKAGLGTAQGGLEISAYSKWRPAPNAIAPNATAIFNGDFLKFATSPQGPVDVDVDGTKFTVVLGTTGAGSIYQISGGLRQAVATLAAGINAAATSKPTFMWKARAWGDRLVFVSTGGPDAFKASHASISIGGSPIITDAKGDFTFGTRASQLQGGTDGGPPAANNYESVFEIIDREVDIFNLMVLPPNGPTDIGTDVLGPASVFCQKRRAFLLVDAPSSWKDAQTAMTQVGTQRIGLATEYAGLFYPKLTVAEGSLRVPVGASGAVAGLMARIDGERGVWKAPAGIEADIRGIVGVEKRFSDDENGVLNPKAINTVRVFPTGVVNWGARTMAGDDSNQTEYKYIPIRRLALFMEESLYRGLKWVVFEPNDEPLWAQIRLNVGAFMHNLFRQGAFQGTTPKDAYFVRCDAETTTQNDRDLGIVNIWVGFAPLKPAEFVVLYLQQMAGQILA